MAGSNTAIRQYAFPFLHFVGFAGKLWSAFFETPIIMNNPWRRNNIALKKGNSFETKIAELPSFWVSNSNRSLLLPLTIYFITTHTDQRWTVETAFWTCLTWCPRRHQSYCIRSANLGEENWRITYRSTEEMSRLGECLNCVISNFSTTKLNVLVDFRSVQKRKRSGYKKKPCKMLETPTHGSILSAHISHGLSPSH